MSHIALAATGSAEVDRIQKLTRQSTLREKVLEHKLLGELGLELLERGIDFSELRASCDRDGFDVVLDTVEVTRHIQLKGSVAGGSTRNVPVNKRLASRPGGCVIWSVLDPATRSFSEYRWFGGEPGMPLPDPGNRAVRHTRANSQGIKPIRPDIRHLSVGRFERLSSIAAVVDRLFGLAK